MPLDLEFLGYLEDVTMLMFYVRTYSSHLFFWGVDIISSLHSLVLLLVLMVQKVQAHSGVLTLSACFSLLANLRQVKGNRKGGSHQDQVE